MIWNILIKKKYKNDTQEQIAGTEHSNRLLRTDYKNIKT